LYPVDFKELIPRCLCGDGENVEKKNCSGYTDDPSRLGTDDELAGL
jgi:hypothetical protein